MIVWGGYNSGGRANINTGAEYNPTTNSWKPLSTLGAPSPRDMHTAVWTGTVMIVWGGFDFNFLSGSYHLNTGGKYNPSTNSWLHTTITGAPTGREIHTAIWTGKQMIVWGGTDGSQDINTGGRYTP
jgi:N-acetylneuraminic acid mutarotase